MKKILLFLMLCSTSNILSAQVADFTGVYNGDSVCTLTDTISFLSAVNNLNGNFYGNGVTDFNDGTAHFSPYQAGLGEHIITYLIPGVDTLSKTVFVSPPIKSSVIPGCDSVFFDGQFYYNDTTIIYDTIYTPSVYECDTLVTFNIEVFHSFDTIINIVECQGNVVNLNGVIYTSDIVVHDSLNTVNGCDSLVIYNISFDSLVIQTIDTMVCDSLELNGSWIYNDTIFNDTLMSINGCDSLSTTYIVTVINSSTSINSITACDSVLVNGNYYYSDTILTETLFNINGCDSLVETVVDILNVAEGTIVNNSGLPLSNSKVLLISFNPTDSTVSIVDSVTTDSSGSFSFNNLASNYYLKAVPNSIDFPNDIPTYYQNSGVFQFADNISCNDSIVFSTIQANNPGGNGFISGYIGSGAGKLSEIGDPLEYTPLFLLNASDEVVAYIVTDSEGYFEFNNIPCGVYKLWADDIRVVDNLLSTTNLDLREDCSLSNIEITINNKEVTIDSETSIRNVFTNGSVSIYPNPSDGYINIDVDNVELTSIKLIDLHGKLVRAYTSYTSVIDVSDISNGMYFIELKQSEEGALFKVVINH